jgi:hypothetical protein
MTAIATTSESVLLTVEEREDLVRLEGVVRKNARYFQEFVKALAEIRDRRLWRESFPNFGAYCQERFNFKKRQGDALVQAARVVVECEQAGLPAPINQKQAIEMAHAARDKAIARADKKAINAMHPSSRRGQLPSLKIKRAHEKTQTIEDILAHLGRLHRNHPHSARADELLGLYRETILPWPAGPLGEGEDVSRLLNMRQTQILGEITNAGKAGLTDGELQTALAMSAGIELEARRQLAGMELIADSGQTRATQIVWVAARKSDHHQRNGVHTHA